MNDCIKGAPNVDCDCKRAQHVHGDRVTYVIDKCRGDACREAARLYERHRERMNLYGRGRLVDAEPVRQHVRTLMEQGMGWKRVARAAGVTPSVVGKLLYGSREPGHPDYRPPQKQVSRKSADAILAVTLTRTKGSSVDSTGAMRRLQALVCIGWSQSLLARRLDLEGCTVWNIIHGHRENIEQGTHDRIAVFFDEHWNTRPSDHAPEVVSRSINHAQRMGWVPAAAWDDIDDPDDAPAVETLRTTPSRAASGRIEDLEDLAGFGCGWDEETVRRAGWGSLNSAAQALKRLGRTDLEKRLRANTRAAELGEHVRPRGRRAS